MRYRKLDDDNISVNLRFIYNRHHKIQESDSEIQCNLLSHLARDTEEVFVLAGSQRGLQGASRSAGVKGGTSPNTSGGDLMINVQ